MSYLKEKTNFLEGEVLLINKPLTWTSFDVVNKIRGTIKRHLQVKKIKVGHAGTLDPLATGLVIVCTGKNTKKIDSYQALEKEYVATIELGRTTPSFDLETETDNTYPIEHINKEKFEQAIDSFIGDIEQIPPVFSAIKHEGKRAYDYARKGEDIKLKAKSISIYSIEILSFDLPNVELKIKCSKGTYIRSLARDIGEKLDSGAVLTSLCRTRIGELSIENAISIEEFENNLENS